MRGKRPDGRHDIETVFAFCTDGDLLSARGDEHILLETIGPFAAELSGCDNLVLKAAHLLRDRRDPILPGGGAAMILTSAFP